jgi:HlyD family secretion protein
VAALTSAQQSYATAKANWEFVAETGQDPTDPDSPNPAKPGETVKNKLSDTQRQQYYDAYVQSEAALRSAEAAVQQAQVAYDTARQAEVSGVCQAEEQVAQASARLEQLEGAVDADLISGAQAEVASAQANLERMRGEQRAGALEAAEAVAKQARAQLALLQAGPRPGDLAVAKAQIQRAEAELQMAQLALERAELKAPFAGTVASVSIEANEYAAAGQPILRMADMSHWQIETTDLTELAIAAVHEGAPVTLSFDALPDVTLLGRVAGIQAFGENQQGDITYVVVVDPAQQEERLRWNMTAAVTIVP